MRTHSVERVKPMRGRSIKVQNLARVEGEGSLYVRIKKDESIDIKFTIFEPPRFFEAFLRGRDYTEAPDITARICGICPIAYQLSAAQAMENALGVTVDGPLRALRRLIYCGEWIESHMLHVYMLHAPDFLGYDDAIQMVKEYPEFVQRGLKLKKVGNELIELLGGRAIHPVNIRVGGFYRVPTKDEFEGIAERLKWARDAALETARWVATFSYPDYEYNCEFVSLCHPHEYPLTEGRLLSSRGLAIDVRQYEANFAEEHVEHSTALHSVMRERGAYCVGPLARYNLNFFKLTPLAQDAAREAGLDPVCLNPFKSIIVRSVETVYACEEALRIIDEYEVPDTPVIEIYPHSGMGYGCTEAPRGSLYHRYRIDDRGKILDAKIVAPTSQNQKSIENDLRQFIEQHLDLTHSELQWKCEQSIRNYDPCISCSAHFLKLKVERE